MFYFLLIYVLFLIGYFVFSAAAVYHLKRFGYVGDLTRPVSWIFIVLSTIVILASVILIAFRSWPMDFTQ